MKRNMRLARLRELERVIQAYTQEIFGHARPQIVDGKVKEDMTTCGTCDMTWNDALCTSYTPAPSGRCPYEYIHPEIAELTRLRRKA